MTWRMRLLAVFIPLAACSGAGETRTVTGELTYLERIALPPEAQAQVALRAATINTDSNPDDSARPVEVIAQKKIEITRAVPIPFQLAYSVNAVDPAHNLVIDAWIFTGDQVLFAVTEASQVQVGSSAPMRLTLRRPRHVTYACADGLRTVVAFPMTGELAFLEASGDTPVALRAQPVAAGFHYTGDGYGLRGRGREVMLRRPSGSETRCDAQLPDTAG